MKLTRIIQTLLLLFVLGGVCQAQRPRPAPTPDPYDEYLTKLELLLEKTGAVIVKGSTNVGIVNGQNGGSATFTSWEMLDVQTGRAEHGVSVLITEPGRADERDLVYVDYDELDPLIKGLDSIIKLDNTVTKLSRFEAQYRTRGGLSVFRFNTPGGYGTAVSAGGVRGGPRLHLRPTAFVEFRDMLESAKTIIDDARK